MSAEKKKAKTTIKSPSKAKVSDKGGISKTAAPKKTSPKKKGPTKKSQTLAGHRFKAKPQKTPMYTRETTKKKWYLIDLDNQVLGRVATTISKVLRGKHQPTFTPHADTGDFVVAINADKIRLTGKKWRDKKYFKYTGYTGGIRSISAKDLLAKNPQVIITHAVRGMLPKNILGRNLLKNLKVYVGSEHPHASQKPLNLS